MHQITDIKLAIQFMLPKKEPLLMILIAGRDNDHHMRWQLRAKGTKCCSLVPVVIIVGDRR